MHPPVAFIPHTDRSMIPDLTLGGVWFAGVSLGLWAARLYGEPVMAWSLTAGGAVLSFAGACVVTMLPLFLSVFAVYFFHRTGVYLVCALRGICVGYMLGSFVLVGGLWLGVLLLFSGLCISPVLLWFLRRRLTLGECGLLRDTVGCFLAAAVIAAMDTWVVAPFLVCALSI